jgi:hypothetical protein
MDVGESLFGWVWRKVVAKRDAPSADSTPVARIEALGHLLSGRPWRCAVVRDHHKPPPVGWTFLKTREPRDGRAEEPTREELARLILGVFAFKTSAVLPSGTSQAEAERATAAALPSLGQWIAGEFPEGRRDELLDELARASEAGKDVSRRLGSLPRVGVEGAELTTAAARESESAAPPASLALKTRPPSAVEEEEASGDMPLQHVFEKALTADEYQGGQRTLDGGKDGSWSAEVLAELEVDRIIRTNEAAQGYADGALLDIGTAPAEVKTAKTGEGKPYPEWFEGSQRYKDDWCVVLEIPRAEQDAKPTSRRDRDARHDAMVKSLKSRPEWRRRLLSGEELDLQAVTDWRADVAAGAAGAAGDDRVYMSRRLFDLDAAVVILIDQSLSTDTWTHGRAGVPPRHVLDVLRKTAATYAAVLEEAGARLEVASFNSLTRKQCRYQLLKAFEDGWHGTEERIAGLTAADYTRLGPVLRHAGARLAKVSARRRMILVLSDAKPTDHDAYEGKHGVADVRRAVQELSRAGMATSVVALNSRDAKLHDREFPKGTVKYAVDATEAVTALHEHVTTACRRRGSA